MLTQEWVDEYLAWDEDNYGGLKSLEIDVDQIWSPSVTLLTRYGTTTTLNVIKYKHMHCDEIERDY